jgi:hypothetical protein
MNETFNADASEPTHVNHPRPWVLFAAFALVLCWALFREWPLTTPIACLCLGGLLVHVARVVADGRPQVIEYLVMTAGIALVLSGPNLWISADPPPEQQTTRLVLSLAGLTVIGGPLIAANIAWAGLLATGVWTSFRKSGRWMPAILGAISIVSSGIFLLGEFAKALSRA